MLSKASRWLTYLTALLYAILGLLLFFLPVQFAPVFAWKVTSFMTIGGRARAVASFLWNKSLTALLHHSIACSGLISFITLAVGIPLIFAFCRLGAGVLR
jgi:uncharacterized membrane protein HdeD (DUF308 family)